MLNFLLFIMAAASPAWAGGSEEGTLKVTTLVRGESVAAVVRINKPNDSGYEYWSMYQPGGPALATPLSVSLPSGEYHLHVKPYGVKSPIFELMVPISIEAGKIEEQRVEFPVGLLKVLTEEEGSGKSVAATARINQGWKNIFPDYATYQNTPFEVTLSPGKYTLKVSNTRDGSNKAVDVEIKAGQTVIKTLTFPAKQVGTMDVRLKMDGEIIPRVEFTQYAEVTIFDSATHNQVMSLNHSQFFGQPDTYPSGIYDIEIKSNVIGAKTVEIKGVHIENDQTTDNVVSIPSTGVLKLAGRWTDQPINLLDCIHYHTPHLAGLMGGPPPVSRGKCLDPTVYMIAWISTLGRNDGNVGKINNSGIPRKLIAGIYDITAWPKDHREFAQTIKGVEITSGSLVQKELSFRWPDLKK